MSIHQIIYETIGDPAREVMELIGSGNPLGVLARQERMRQFLASNEWNEEEYKKWIRHNNTTATRSSGLGDTIAKVTSAVGLTPCGGCKQRQAKLNKIFWLSNPI